MNANLLCFLGLLITGPAQAQTARDSTITRRNIVKINPVSLLLGQVSTFYERGLSRRVSVVVGVGFGGATYKYEHNKANVPSPGRFRYERLTLEQRYYLTRKHRAPIGFYVGAYVRFARLTLDDYTFDSQGQFIRNPDGTLVKEKRRLYVFMPGVLAGGQVPLGRRVTFEPFYGLQYQLPTQRPPLRQSLPEAMSKQQLIARYGLTIGYRF